MADTREPEFIPYIRWAWSIGRARWWKPSVVVPLSLFVPGGSLLFYAHYIEPGRFRTRRLDLSLAGLPSSFRSSLVHISDLHLTRDGRWARRMIAAIRKVEPQHHPLGVITGDFVKIPMRRDEVIEVLRALPRPAAGWYAVPGGWEHACGISGGRFAPFCQEAGIHPLVNEAVQVDLGGQTVNLVGLDDPECGRPDLRRAMAGADPELPTILLMHQPDLFDEVAGPGVDLVLAGHSHGGQVRLPWKGPLYLPRGCQEYTDGVFHRDGTTLVISRGLGTTVAPVRLLSRPEVTVVRLRGLAGPDVGRSGYPVEAPAGRRSR